MHRTNVYLTDEQERALDARARMTGTTRSSVLRSILDEALATERSATEDDLDAAFAELGDVYVQITKELFDDDDDLRIA